MIITRTTIIKRKIKFTLKIIGRRFSSGRDKIAILYLRAGAHMERILMYENSGEKMHRVGLRKCPLRAH